MSFARGDFSFIKASHERRMLEDAYAAMGRVEGSWEYLARPEVPSREDGFMFSRDQQLEKIGREVDKGGEIGHSGSSYGWTMRQIEAIAKNGWESYVERRLDSYKQQEEEEKARKEQEKKQNDAFFAEMSQIPHFKAQIDAVKALEAKQGGLTYSQLRDLMG